MAGFRSNSDKSFWLELDKLREEISDSEEFPILSTKETVQTRNPANAAAVMDYRPIILLRIEKVVKEFVKQLSEKNAPFLKFANVNTWGSIRFESNVGVGISAQPVVRTVSFDSFNSVRKLGLILKTLSTIYLLIQRNTFSTKRDIFYQDPKLFGSQSCLDTTVEDISLILQVPRWQLHVMATSKGLVAGDLKFVDGAGFYVDCNQSDAGVLVPNSIQDISILKSSARFVLVIEKDATFQKLMESGFTEKCGPCILLTGKGFPDVNTRMLLNRLWKSFRLPTFGLLDADPHGIEIMAIYKFGSRSMCSEVDNLCVPSLKWLGLLPSDIDKLHICREALMPLTKTDKAKARNLLERSYVASQPSWKHEIEVILTVGMKAEIQCLDSLSHLFLTDVYIPNKLRFGGWL